MSPRSDQEGLPRLLAFMAAWSDPAAVMEAPLGELAVEFDGRVLVDRIEAQPGGRAELAHAVTEVPTFVLIDEDGTERWRAVGARPKPEIKSALEDVASS